MTDRSISKLVVTGVLVTLVSLGLLSCGDDQSPILRGTNLPETLNGKQAYLYDASGVVDSALVTDGKFEIKLPDTTSLRRCDVVLGTLSLPYLTEPGVSTVTLPEDPKKGLTYDESSTALNRQVGSLSREYNELRSTYLSQSADIQQEVQGGELTADAAAKLTAVAKDHIGGLAKLSRKYFAGNEDNPLGLMAINIYPMEDPKGYCELFESAGELICSNADLRSRYELQSAAVKTSEGELFYDVVMKDETGKEVHLSDLMDEGKYLLIDVWASWCSPCRAAMPHLAQVVREHPTTLKVVSVGGINESYEDNTRARDEVGMTWTSFFDSEAALADAYGIQGIPMMILISPDGTILLRTHDVHTLDAKIEELGI